MFTLEHAPQFLEQLDEISPAAAKLIERKVELIKQNPFRSKRLFFPGRHLFRIRFEDMRKEKRLIYEVVDNKIIIRCILDRNKEYEDLERYL